MTAEEGAIRHTIRNNANSARKTISAENSSYHVVVG